MSDEPLWLIRARRVVAVILLVISALSAISSYWQSAAIAFTMAAVSLEHEIADRRYARWMSVVTLALLALVACWIAYELLNAPLRKH